MEAAGAIRALPAQLRARSFERECEQLRPLGVAYVMRRFSGSLNEADAEDAVAEVLIRLHRRMVAGRPPTNLRAAFFTSVRNAAIDQLRARSVRPTVALEAAADTPADAPLPPDRAESREDAVRLQEALGRMRGNYREAILLRFGLGLTVPEIAQHLQISLPAAKKLILRATAQVKKRLESIEGAEFCPEMRDLARRSLFEKEASGLASEGETEILRAHFEHCGSCRTFLSALHERLHEFGSTALLGLAVDHAGGTAIGEPLARWAGSVGEAAQSAVDRVRHLAFKASGALQPGDAGTAGALAGTGQKIAAICTAGAATTATCLATGIVGPGVGVTVPPLIPSHDTAPAHVREAASSPAFSSAPPATAAAASSAVAESPAGSGARSSPAGSKSPADANKVKAQAKSPAQQSQAQFGFEGTSPSTSSTTSSSSPSTATASSVPASEPAPAPAPPPAPPPASSSPSSGSSGGAGSGSESFGFGG
jgi:RNA polymerase sigma factor (sigma-70 family)